MLKTRFLNSIEDDSVPPSVLEKLPDLKTIREQTEKYRAEKKLEFEIEENGDTAIVLINGKPTTRLRLSPSKMFIKRRIG